MEDHLPAYAIVELSTQGALRHAEIGHYVDHDSYAYQTLQDGVATLEKESIHQLAGRQKKFIEQLEAALIRIANKT